MELAFYVSAAVAVFGTLMVVTRPLATHALLWLVLSLLAAAAVFFSLGAPFVAAMEVIVYAGAIMVLFVFAIMMLNLAHPPQEELRSLLNPSAWLGPALLAMALLAVLAYVLLSPGSVPARQDVAVDAAPRAEVVPATAGDLAMQQLPADAAYVGPKQVSVTLFTHYLLGVELASVLLLAALVGVVHLARAHGPEKEGVA